MLLEAQIRNDVTGDVPYYGWSTSLSASVSGKAARRTIKNLTCVSGRGLNPNEILLDTVVINQTVYPTCLLANSALSKL